MKLVLEGELDLLGLAGNEVIVVGDDALDLVGELEPLLGKKIRIIVDWEEIT
jgi:hypothetical protein